MFGEGFGSFHGLAGFVAWVRLPGNLIRAGHTSELLIRERYRRPRTRGQLDTPAR
jgi:hypothetical protein